MKGHSKMLKIFIGILFVGLLGCLITWIVIAYMGRSQTLTVKSIENPSGDIYLIHLTKPKDMTWEAGSYAKFTLPDVKESDQKSRWLTIASTSDENDIVLLAHNSGSLFKETLTNLEVGSEIKMSWAGSKLTVKDSDTPLVLFASDVGISAIRSIVKDWAGKREIYLLHLDKGVTVFDEEMTELASSQEQLTYERSASLDQSQESMAQAGSQYGNQATYLLAGQPDDVEAIEQMLKDQGLNSDKIKSDSFRGLE